MRHMYLLESWQFWLFRALSDALLDTLSQTFLQQVVRSFETHLWAENGRISTPQTSNIARRAVHTVLHIAANAQTHRCRREHFIEYSAISEFNLDALVQGPGLLEHGRFRLVQADTRNRNLLRAQIFLFISALNRRIFLVWCS